MDLIEQTYNYKTNQQTQSANQTTNQAFQQNQMINSTNQQNQTPYSMNLETTQPKWITDLIKKLSLMPNLENQNWIIDQIDKFQRDFVLYSRNPPVQTNQQNQIINSINQRTQSTNQKNQQGRQQGSKFIQNQSGFVWTLKQNSYLSKICYNNL